MSPEQAEGAADVDAASDVWAMGVMLYRCLSGALPFAASGPSALLLAIARGDHVPLGTRRRELPAPVATWVEGALRLDRRERFRDMTEMLAALDRALAGDLPIAAVVRETRSTRRVLVAAAIAAVAVVAVAAAWSASSPAPPPRDTPAPAPAVVATAPPPVSPPPPSIVSPPPSVLAAPETPTRRTGTRRPPPSSSSPPTTATRSASGLASEW
jgi:serine/threonine-protein kinase